MRILAWMLVAVLAVGWSYREWTNRVGTGVSAPPLPAQLTAWPAKGVDNPPMPWRFMGTDEMRSFNFWLGESDGSGCSIALSDQGERTVILFVHPGMRSISLYDDSFPRYELPLGRIRRVDRHPSDAAGPFQLYDWNGGTVRAGKFNAWSVTDENMDGIPDTRFLSAVPNLKEVFIEGRFQPLDRSAPSGGFQQSVNGRPIELHEGAYRFKPAATTAATPTSAHEIDFTTPSEVSVNRLPNKDLAYLLTHVDIAAESPLPHLQTEGRKFGYRIMGLSAQGDCRAGCPPSIIYIAIWDYQAHRDGNLKLFRVDGVRFWNFKEVEEYRGEETDGYFLSFTFESRLEPKEPKLYRAKVGFSDATVEPL